MVSPKNHIHTSDIVRIEQAVFTYMDTWTKQYIYKNKTIKEIEATYLREKEEKVEHWKGWRAEKEEGKWCNCILIKKLEAIIDIFEQAESQKFISNAIFKGIPQKMLFIKVRK